jgi:hypothetical protein
MALSQWGNSIFGIMSRLNQDAGDPALRAASERTMGRGFDYRRCTLSIDWVQLSHSLVAQLAP